MEGGCGGMLRSDVESVVEYGARWTLAYGDGQGIHKEVETMKDQMRGKEGGEEEVDGDLLKEGRRNEREGRKEDG